MQENTSENIPVENTPVEKKSDGKKKSKQYIIQFLVLTVLLGFVYTLGNLFPILSSRTEKNINTDSMVSEINDSYRAESETVQKVETTLDFTQLNEAIAAQDFPRYGVLDNGVLTLLSLIGGQVITKDIQNIKYGAGSSGYGSNAPLNSPDLKKIAYIDESNNLHLMNSKGEVDVLISDELNVTYISGWSSDSNKLIFYANNQTLKDQLFPESGPGFQAEEPTGIIKVERNAKETGFYLLDTETENITYLSSFDGASFESWIDDSRVLLKFGNYSNEKYIVFDINSFEADAGIMNGGLENDFASQYVFSADGKKWAFTWHGGNNESQSASIILADFPSVEGKELMKAGFAQIQAPKISPDGKMVTFMSYDEQNGPLFTYLYDGEKVEKVVDGTARVWISNTQFIYMIANPAHASNPDMASKLFIYDTEMKKSTQIHSFTEK